MIVLRDQPFRPGVADCLADVYLGEKSPTRALLWFHGGGLENGSRHLDEHFPRLVTDRSCALISTEYRLAPQVQHPVWLEDAAVAAAWSLALLRTRGYGDLPLFLSGHSAGAWVAAMLGLDPIWLHAVDVPSERIAGIIPISGQTTTHHRIRRDRGLLGRLQPAVDDAAPLFHAAEASPPMLCVTGAGDLPLRSAENRFLIETLAANGHRDHAFHEIPGRDHNSIAAGLGDPDDVVTRLMWSFIDRLVPGSQRRS